MKRKLLLIITILTCSIFINTVRAEDIPRGDYTTNEIWYEDLQIVDTAGNPIKESTICFNDDYTDEYCYKMTLQDNGLYKSYDTTYICDYCSWSEASTEEEWETSFYIQATGYQKSKIYNVKTQKNEKYSISSSNKVTDKYTYTYYDESKKLDKITLEPRESKRCSIVNGTGKNIGDEIACGTEHFYIISNDGKEVKLMAKYNLYVGANWNKYVLNNTYSYCDWSPYKCYSYIDGKEVDDFYETLYEKYSLEGISGDILYLYKTNKGTYGYVYSNSKDTKTTKLYTYTNITNDEEGYALQSDKALGVTGEQGNANYPIYATTLMFNASYDYDYYDSDFSYICGELYGYAKSIDNFANGYTDMELLDNHEIMNYLSTYKYKLNDQGYTVSDINIISIKELNELVKNITGKELPLTTWYNNSLSSTAVDEDVYVSGDLKKYLSNDYSWLWNTSYLTRTLAGNDFTMDGKGEFAANAYVYFVSSQGEICFSESSCWYSIPRAGVRPIVTMSADQIYNVYTKDDGNGTITYERKDGVVHFTLTPKEGYVLGEVKVTDADGNTITFTDYTFTMPSADVTIEAIFKKIDNPLTSDIAIITIAVLLVISLIIFLIQSKKLNKKIS